MRRGEQMYRKIKRVMDAVVSFLGLVLLSWVFLILIVAIKLDSKGPILFKQKRVGIGKSHFYIYKFRTMRTDTPKDVPTHLLENPEQYITKVGRFLRKTSLDELPQIINILKGDMAIVGPRPALWNQFDLIAERDRYGANDILPGLTGWAQINGRDELEIEEKARLDGEYVKRMGFLFDIKCIVRTITSVWKHEGVVEGGTGTLHGHGIKQGTVMFIVNHNITIYNFRKELVESLVKDNYRVVAILPVTEETKKITDLGCEVIDVPVERRGTNPIHDFKLFLTYRKIMKKVRPDVVLTYTIKPNVYGGLAAGSLKVPYICTVTGLGVAIEGGGILKKISLMLYKAGLSKVEKVFFQNAENQKVFEEAKIGKGRYELVNGSGVNIEEYSSIPFPGDKEAVEFVFISRVQKAKGIDNYLEMAEQIKAAYPDTVFHILGFCEEDYKERLEKMTKDGMIRYHGMQQDIRPVLRRCQCLVHPSFHEGMSNVCMEAAAAGRVVIASNISGCREIVEEGVTGFLVNPGDTKDLARGVEQFLNLRYNEKMQMGENGRRKMRKDFNRQTVVLKYREEIKKVTCGHS